MTREVTERQLPRWVRAINLVSIVVAIPAAVAFSLLVLHVIADITSRTLFNHPLPATLEVTQYWWMMAIVFGGLGLSQLRGDHIRATVVPELLDRRWRRGADIFAVVLLLVLSMGLAWYGWQAAVGSFAIRQESTSSPAVPIWPLIFLVPVGAVSLILQCVATIYEIATGEELDAGAEEVI
jgi:TRAP-type C4-dicarboxylate transport system permease small subunit